MATTPSPNRSANSAPTLSTLPEDVKRKIVEMCCQQDHQTRGRLSAPGSGASLLPLPPRAPEDRRPWMTLNTLFLLNKDWSELAAPFVFEEVPSGRVLQPVFQHSILARHRRHFQLVRIGSIWDPLWIEVSDLSYREKKSINDYARDEIRLRALDYLFSILPSLPNLKSIVLEQLYLETFLRTPIVGVNFAGPSWTSSDVRLDAALASFLEAAKRTTGVYLWYFRPRSAANVLQAFKHVSTLVIRFLCEGAEGDDDALPKAIAGMKDLRRLGVRPGCPEVMQLSVWDTQEWGGCIRGFRLTVTALTEGHIALLRQLAPSLEELTLGIDELDPSINLGKKEDSDGPTLPAPSDPASTSADTVAPPSPSPLAFPLLTSLTLTAPLLHVHLLLTTIFAPSPLRSLFIAISSASGHSYEPSAVFPLLPSDGPFFTHLKHGIPTLRYVEIADAWHLDSHAATISRALSVACRELAFAPELAFVRVRRDEWDPVGLVRVRFEDKRTEWDDRAELECLYESVVGTLEFGQGLLEAARRRGDVAGMNEVGLLLGRLKSRRHLEWD